MELIKRYIYAVTQKLPVKQRAEIEKELHGLIEDMLEERLQGDEPSKNDIEQVLIELGDPSEMANRYRDTKRRLIGPELFPSYVMVLKITIVSVVIAMAVVFIVDTIHEPQQIAGHFGDRLVGMLSGSFQAFTWVTIIFAIIDYFAFQTGKMNLQPAAWQPSDLPDLPDYRTEIKRSGPITGIILNVLIAALFIFSIDLIGVWRIQSGDGTTVVPFLNHEALQRFLPAILAVIGVHVLKNIFMLIRSKWTLTLVGFELVIALLTFVTAIWVFSDHSVWNQDFMQGLAEAGLLTAGSEAFDQVGTIWTIVQDYILYIFGITIIIQLIAMAVKAYQIKNRA